VRAFEDLLIGEFDRHPERRFVVFGCLPKLSRRLMASDRVLLIEPREIHTLESIIDHGRPIDDVAPFHLRGFDNYQSDVTDRDFFLQVAQGCANACTYCNIKLAKGHVKSRPLDRLVDEARTACEAGARTLTLLADDCGSYGVDLGTDLVALVARLVEVSPDVRLKIYAIHPRALLGFQDALAPYFERLAYICLPCQSGSERLVALMNRSYDLQEVRALLARIKSASPDTHLCTHVMYNFPSETAHDFEASLDLARSFDFTVFLKFMENANTRSAAIVPKCTEADAAWKEAAIRAHLAEGRFRGCITGDA
jgi:tRNA A37 methylthiotransferase MiaB